MEHCFILYTLFLYLLNGYNSFHSNFTSSLRVICQYLHTISTHVFSIMKSIGSVHMPKGNHICGQQKEGHLFVLRTG